MGKKTFAASSVIAKATLTRSFTLGDLQAALGYWIAPYRKLRVADPDDPCAGPAEMAQKIRSGGSLEIVSGNGRRRLPMRAADVRRGLRAMLSCSMKWPDPSDPSDAEFLLSRIERAAARRAQPKGARP